MISVTVSLASALICLNGVCHPALIGADVSHTPPGSYSIEQQLAVDPLYGGDVLVFKTEQDGTYAIHRLWDGRPEEQREYRLSQGTEKERRISAGCINVADDVYRWLRTYCNTGCTLTITEK